MDAVQNVITLVVVVGIVVLGAWAIATDFYNARRK